MVLGISKERGNHAHMDGNGRPLISKDIKDETRTIFSADPTFSSKNAATEIGTVTRLYGDFCVESSSSFRTNHDYMKKSMMKSK